MASFSALVKALISSLLIISMSASMVASFQFQIGGQRGWVVPTGNESETYNEWAARNRFQIGDTIEFKYKNDSVLVVSARDYLDCNVSNPIHEFNDGNTVFEFDRPGFFYFISGQQGHCNAGQRVIIRVMHPSEVESPVPAPSPNSAGESDGWSSESWGPPGRHANSTNKLFVVSRFMTALGGLVFLLYLFL